MQWNVVGCSANYNCTAKCFLSADIQTCDSSRQSLECIHTASVYGLWGLAQYYEQQTPSIYLYLQESEGSQINML